MCYLAVESARNTAQGDVEILVYLDEDDTSEYWVGGTIIRGAPRRAGEAIRYLYSLAKGDMFYFGSDDITWETPGWDEIFRKTMPAHGLAVLYPDMGDSCNPCFTRKWVETVGLWPEYFKHFGPDTWYADIAKRAGTLIRVPEVRMRHERVQDETYRRTRADHDGQFAQRMLNESADERQKLAEKIKTLLSLESSKG
jgi:hypothetical protein